MVRQASSDSHLEADQHWLEVDELGPITPLDAQFGVDPKKSVPDALQEVLFGQPEPTEAEQSEWGGAVPPMLTYAVLDAAKMPYLLTSLLESSGLRYQSLFQGDAQEELAEHAPYLVELVDDNDFTQRLFTGPDGIGGLWEKELGVFIRSRVGFEALRKHLRKFTKLQDEDGEWFYFRFWETTFAEVFWSALQMDIDHVIWRYGKHLASVTWVTHEQAVTVKHCLPRFQGNTPPSAISAYRPYFQSLLWQRFVNKVMDALIDEGPSFSNMPAEQVQSFCDSAREAGFSQEAALWDMVRAMVLIKANNLGDQTTLIHAWQEATLRLPDERSAARRFLAHVRNTEAE